MVTDDRTSGDEGNQRRKGENSNALVSNAGPEPLVPKELTSEEIEELKNRSASVIREVEEATGRQEMELVDSVSAIGMQAQKESAAELRLLRVRVSDLLQAGGASQRVTNDLIELKRVLNRINPNEVGRRGLVGFLRTLPLLKVPARVLERIAMRYEEVSQQSVAIEKHLRDGQLMLQRDNIELRKLYEDVERQQLPIRRNAYLGELLMERLGELLERTTDQRKRNRVQNVLYDVSMRVQDLRTMEQVHGQFFVSIEMTRENNTRLGQAVDRTLTLATNTLMVGLAIQSALARQKRVLEATQRTREFLGELIAANAAAIRQYSSEIGDVYKNPVIAIEKLTEAHKDLIEALATVDRVKAEGIEAARANISKLRELSVQLEEKTSAPAAQLAVPSLEA